MYRAHHFVIIRESNSSYGFNLPWWDRLLGTHKHQPGKGREGMTIGLSDYCSLKRLTLPWLLAPAFVGDSDPVPINLHWKSLEEDVLFNGREFLRGRNNERFVL